jgi:cobalamin biosynthesis protein CobW
VLTGFLGAGKTTLLRSLLTQADGRRIAVIVNEFGDAGFDGGLVEECAAKACAPGDIVELTNGCICCTVAEDFLPTMEKLLSRDRPLDAIVIETSGLALPQPLLKAFAWPGVRTRATVDGVVTVVDALALSEGRVTLDEGAVAAQRAADNAVDHDDPIEEVFEDQLACADLVVLNKTDLTDAATLGIAEREVTARLRPQAKHVTARFGKVAPQLLLGLSAAAEDDLASRPSQHDVAGVHDHDDFDSFVVGLGAIADPAMLARRLSAIIATYDILRLKGFLDVPAKEFRQVVQAVGPRIEHYFDRPWRADEARQSRLVVIGRKGIDRAVIAAAILAAVPA